MAETVGLACWLRRFFLKEAEKFFLFDPHGLVAIDGLPAHKQFGVFLEEINGVDAEFAVDRIISRPQLERTACEIMSI